MGIYPSEQPEQHALEADNHHGARRNQRVHVKRHIADGERPCRDDGTDDDACRAQGEAQQEEQPARAEEQQETPVPPAVAPAAQVRRAAAAVFEQAWWGFR